MTANLAPPIAAPQQTRGPRPLPLFLELVRDVAARDPELARSALNGLRRYQASLAPEPRRERPIAFAIGDTSLRDCGGDGPPLVLVPSLINPPLILDLDERSSLADALSGSHRVFLLDWGRAEARSSLDLAGHVTHLLVPLVQQIGPAVLIGYCLGGTLALAAATALPATPAVVTLAAPWNFAAYPGNVAATLAGMWRATRGPAALLGALPMEVLQAAFWKLDPERTVAKFAQYDGLARGADQARRFELLEDWANSGEPLPLPAARELIEDLFGKNASGRGQWLGNGLPTCPQLHVTAGADRIVPAATAAPGGRHANPSGHVGMIVGRDAPRLLHAPLRSWLEACGKPG